MKIFKFLTCAICLVIAFTMVEKVDAATYGYFKAYSDLTYVAGTNGNWFKTGLIVEIINAEMVARCENKNDNSAPTSPGTGNGFFEIVDFTAGDAPEGKGQLYFTGTVNLDQYYPTYDGPGDWINLCVNDNKEPLPNTVLVTNLKALFKFVTWDDETYTTYKVNNNIYMDCYWPGTIDEYGLPSTLGGEPLQFICEEYDVFKK